MTSIQPIPNEDEMIRRLMAAGATDDEIVQIVREEKAKRRSQPAASAPTPAPAPSRPLSGAVRRETLPDFGNLGQGFLEGAGESLSKIGSLIERGQQALLRRTGGAGGLRTIKPEDIGQPTPVPELPEATTGSQAIGRFIGGLAPEAALYAGTSGLINPALAGVRAAAAPAARRAGISLARKVATGQTAQAINQAVQVGITTIPQELIAGVIVEGIVRPESFDTAQGALRTGILASAGSLFNAGFAYRAAIKNAKSLAEIAEIQKQIQSIDPAAAPDVPAATGTTPTVRGDTPLYNAADLAMLRTGPQQQGGQLPTAFEAGWRRISQQLEEEAQLRAAQLQNIKPKKEPDILARVTTNKTFDIAIAQEQLLKAIKEGDAAKVSELTATLKELGSDPIVLAAVRGTHERLNEAAKVYESMGGKGVQTNTVPDLGVQQTPNQFLTAAELQQHLDILNMASVMGMPTFKKTGQRWIIPKTQLPAAEEIAARATGTPIKAIDPTIQQNMKDVQRRLDYAATFRNGTLDPEEAQQIVNEMLTMSRRLSRGFEVPRTTPPRPTGTPSPEALKNVEGWDLPGGVKISEPTIEQAAKADDSYKRWVTGSDNPAAPDVPQAAVTVPPPEVAQPLAQDFAGAMRDVKSTISYAPQKSQTWWDATQDFFRNFRQERLDRTQNVKDVNLKAGNLLQSLSGVSQYAEEFFENAMRIATRDADGKIGQRVIEGRTLGQMTKNLTDDQLTDLDAYLKAKTSLDALQKNPKFKTDVPIEKLQTIVELAPPEMKAFGDEFKIVADALIDDAAALGRLSPEAAARMKDGFYAGMSRVMNNATMQQALMRRLGSSRQSLSPLRLMKDNIYTMLNKSRRNYAFSQLLEDYKANPLKYNGIMEPADIKQGLYEVEGYAAMVKDLQENAGMTVKDAEDFAGMMNPSLDRTDGTITIYDNGKPTFWRVSPEILKTRDALNPREIGMTEALLAAIKRPFSISVSAGLDLSLLGPLSDTILTSARVPQFIPVVDTVRGLFHSAFKTDAFQERIAAMGGLGTQVTKGEDVLLKNKGTGIIRRGGEIIATPFDMLQAIVRPLSDATRMGEYLVRRGRMGEDAMTAAFNTRNTLGDFNRVGANMRGWAMVTEFGNVGLQSADAMNQMAKEIYTATKNGNFAPLSKAVATFAGTITLPTIYFWSAAQGDKELEARRKGKNGYRYWWTRAPFDIPMPKGYEDVKQGEIIKVQKPGWWAGQMFGSSVEMMLDGMDSDSQKRFADGILSQLGVNPIPLAAQRLVGLPFNSRNADFSMLVASMAEAAGMETQTNIIPITPRGQVGLDPRIQGNERTTFLGQAAAQRGFNPFVVDYVAEAFGGTLFTAAMRSATDTKATLEASDLPIYGRFFSSIKSPTEGSEMFYRDLKKVAEIDKSVKKSAQFGELDVTQDLINKNGMLLARKNLLNGMAQKITEMNSLMLTIANDDAMSPEGRRQFIDNIRNAQNEMFMTYADIVKQTRK